MWSRENNGLFAALMITSVLLASCGRPSESTDSDTTVDNAATSQTSGDSNADSAAQLFEELIARYQQADSYQRFLQEAEESTDESDLNLTSTNDYVNFLVGLLLSPLWLISPFGLVIRTLLGIFGITFD